MPSYINAYSIASLFLFIFIIYRFTLISKYLKGKLLFSSKRANKYNQYMLYIIVVGMLIWALSVVTRFNYIFSTSLSISKNVFLLQFFSYWLLGYITYFRITEKGVIAASHFYSWSTIASFEIQDTNLILYIRNRKVQEEEIKVLFEKTDNLCIRNILNHYLSKISV